MTPADMRVDAAAFWRDCDALAAAPSDAEDADLLLLGVDVTELELELEMGGDFVDTSSQSPSSSLTSSSSSPSPPEATSLVVRIPREALQIAPRESAAAVGTRALRAIKPAPPPPPPAASAAAPPLRAKCVPLRTGRKTAKDELERLRQCVVVLEQELRQLQLRRSPATNALARDSSRRRHLLIAASQQPQAPSPPLGLWKRLAAHQLSSRRRSEAEHVRLREVLEAQLRVAQGLARMLHRSSAGVMDFRPIGGPELGLKCHCTISESLDDRAFAAETLDALHARVDTAVFAETEHALSTHEMCASRVKTDAATGRRCVEVVSSLVLPFGVEATARGVCTYLNTPAPDIIAGAFRPMDPTAHSLRLASSVKLTRGGADGQFVSRGVGKQFVEASRVVLVWSSQGESDGKLFDARDVRVREVGWGVIEQLAASSSSPSPSTIFRVVMRMFPEVAAADAADDARTARSLGDAVLGMYQQNLAFMQRAVENIVMSAR